MNRITYTRAFGQLYKFDVPVLHADLKFGRNINSKKELQQACISWATWNINHANYRIHHSSQDDLMATSDTKPFKKMGIRSGFPDLWISLGKGQTGYITFKFGKEILTRDQENFRDFLRSEGHKWAVCRTVDEFIKTLAKWGLVSKNKKSPITFQSHKGMSV